MESTVIHPTLGTIVYEESFWTGKRKLTVNGVEAKKAGKKDFVLSCNDQTLVFQLKGSFVTGVKAYHHGECIQLTEPAKWYEIALAIIIPLFVIVWGNSITLNQIFPMVGGAIGGAISALMGMISLTLMKKVKNVGLKFLIWLGFFAGTIFACWFTAIVILAGLLAVA